MSKKPYILLFGGFQGSGKTTVLNKLTKKLNLPIVSPDEIRQELFDKGVEFSSKFRTEVERIAKDQMRDLIRSKQSFVLDNNSTPSRIKEFSEFLSKNGIVDYLLITILLTASKEELVQRISSRSTLKGVYKGTVPEFWQSRIKHGGSLDPAFYDLVIDTEEHSPSRTSELIISHINQQIQLTM